MRAMQRVVLMWIGLLGGLIPVQGAELIVSVERRGTPADEWEEAKITFRQYSGALGGGGQDELLTEEEDEAIHFIYVYNDGWSYRWYEIWNHTITQRNALYESTGVPYRWTLSATGGISPETDPWKDVDWLVDVEVVGLTYLRIESLGWLYSENWDPDGKFWAYSWEPAFQGWLYVYGDGYYYNFQTSEWLLNLVGTGWFYVFESDGSGGTTGFGAWENLIGQEPARLELVDEIVKSEMVLQQLPGLAVGVFQDGEVVHVAGYGYIDMDDPDSTITTSTVMRWASISKPLTAVAAFQLDEAENDYSVTDLVTEHAPYWYPSPDVEDTLTTINHLLSNRSGIHHYGSGMTGGLKYPYDGGKNPVATTNSYVPEADQFNAPSAVGIFAGSGVDFSPPGSQYLYSTFGFNLLGATIEEASPNGYVAWITDNIAAPLGMDSLAVSNGSRSGSVLGCDGALRELELGSAEWKLPGGGWESNIVDLLKFGRGIAEGTLLDNTSRLWMFSGENTSNYRFGIQSFNDPIEDEFFLYHGGSHENVKTHLIVYPNINYGLAIMIPVGHGDAWRISGRIRTTMEVDEQFVGLAPVDDCHISDSTSEDCGYRYSGIWRDTENDVILRRAYRDDAWLREWEFLRECGYYCDDFEVTVEDGERTWSGIFREGPGANGMWRNFAPLDFRQKLQEMAAIGQRPVDVEVEVRQTSPMESTILLSGLFRPGVGDYELITNVTTAELANQRSLLASRGLEIIDVEGYLRDGELRWTSLFVERDDTALYRNYTTEEFDTLRADLFAQGWRVIDIEAYETVNGLRWAGVWEQADELQRISLGKNYCDFIYDHSRFSSLGFELIDMVRFEEEE